MAKSIYKLVTAAFLIAGATLPVQAQEAAFDLPPAGLAANLSLPAQAPAAPQQHLSANPRPVSSSAAAENQTNLRHWSRFSSSAKTSFIRVAPGTKCKGAAVSHYVRPRCVEAGKLPVQQVQNQKGPVKRYLAYNIPAGSCGKLTAPAAAKPSHPQQVQASKKASPKKHVGVPVLSYGAKSGEVTYSVISPMVPSGTAISCYSRYR